MVDSMMASGSVSYITREQRQSSSWERIKNKTSEHIGTESITDTISTKMLNSGSSVSLIWTDVESVRDQLNQKQRWAGKELEAQQSVR